MTNSNKTYKDLKDAKEQARNLHLSKEGQRKEKGGHRNLIREAAEEEHVWTVEEIEALFDIAEKEEGEN